MGKNICIAILFILITGQASIADTTKNPLTWLIAHKPAADPGLVDLVRQHALVLEKMIGQKINVETLPDETWLSAYGWADHWPNAYKSAMVGEVDLVQMPTGLFSTAEPTFQVFGLPMIFRDHAHAERVLTGAIGQKMLKKVEIASGGKLHAFAFTYSGGFRVIASSEELKTAEDFKRLRMMKEDIFLLKNPKFENVLTQTFSAFGSTLIKSQTDPNIIELLARGDVNSAIAPYKEIAEFMKGSWRPKYISEDNLSLFTTVIVMKKSVFDQLPKEKQAEVTKQINLLAREERILFVKSAERSKVELVERGIKITSLNSIERAKLRKLAEPVFKNFELFSGGKELISGIQNEEKDARVTSISK